jgi:Mn2+/Fe2+ NRAMP family transporter
MKQALVNFLKASGPGLMLAAASIGASHVVQSTRAGADYGLALMQVLIMPLPPGSLY